MPIKKELRSRLVLAINQNKEIDTILNEIAETKGMLADILTLPDENNETVLQIALNWTLKMRNVSDLVALTQLLDSIGTLTFEEQITIFSHPDSQKNAIYPLGSVHARYLVFKHISSLNFDAQKKILSR